MMKKKNKGQKSKRQMVEEAALEAASTNNETGRGQEDGKTSASATNLDGGDGGGRRGAPATAAATTTMTAAEAGDWIAELSEAILESPDQAFTATAVVEEGSKNRNKRGGKTTTTRKEPSKMRQLLTLASSSSSSGGGGAKTRIDEQQRQDLQQTSTLAILSLLAIFKDILPSYRIRLPSTKEMAVKVSKETKKLWDYERALLQHYQEFLKLLQRLWEGKKNAPDSLAVTAILALCELLKDAFHFNFRSNLLTAVVRPMNHQLDQVSRACCDAIGFVFAKDAQGDVALEASRQVAKMIRDRGFKVRPEVLRTFHSLPLRVHVDEAEAAKIVAKTNAKKRKRDKEKAAIEAELKESQATVDKVLLARCQSDTLQAVSLTYFRILKSDDLNASHIEMLLPATLEGLAKFAHLINIDTVVDLLEVLKNLLKRVDALPIDAALNCVLTALQTLHGPGKEMKIDQKEYILPLYSQLPRLCSEEASRRNTDIMINCLSAAFIRRREYSTTRVAAFLKQILSVALHAPAHASVPLVAFARQIMQRYSSAQQLLDNEQDVITSGQYNPDVEDPEHSNPFSTSAWELALLKFHLHPSVAGQASAAAESKMLQLPGETPDKLRADLLSDYDELYIPFKRVKKKHPLEPRQSGKKRQLRFITPRTTTTTLI